MGSIPLGGRVCDFLWVLLAYVGRLPFDARGFSCATNARPTRKSGSDRKKAPFHPTLLPRDCTTLIEMSRVEMMHREAEVRRQMPHCRALRGCGADALHPREQQRVRT